MMLKKVKNPIRLRSTRILIVYFDFINPELLKRTLSRIFQIKGENEWECYIQKQSYADGTTHTIVYVLLQNPCDVYSSSLHFEKDGILVPIQCWTLTKNSETLGFACLSLYKPFTPQSSL